MIRLFTRALAGAALGGLLGLAAVWISYQFTAPLVIEFDRERSPLLSGMYGAERVSDDTYAWSRGAAALTLPGLDRSAPWTCVVRLKGGRSDAATLPDATLTVDGVIAARTSTTNDYQDISTTLPARSGNGATLGLSVSNTFRPGSDPRDLGVMVDRWACAPDGAAAPPSQVRTAAVVGGAALGLALALLGASWPALLGALAVFALGHAVPLTIGSGPYAPTLTRGLWITVTGAALLVAAALVWRVRGREWSGEARVALAWTLAVAVLKILVLLHPDKPLIDAVFHAHRVQWVLEGRYFFSQTLPSGVQMPYAIGLYVFAAPFTALTTDIVSLLRIIIVTAEATGGLLLYAMVARLWHDRRAAVAAALLFPLLPLPFVITGNANMTNVFAQALALAAVAAAVIPRLEWARPGPVVMFAAITAAALLSHISTLSLLAIVLGCLCLGYWWRGDAGVRRAGWTVAAGAMTAAIVAVAVFYRHFTEAFRSALVMRSSSSSTGLDPVGLADRAGEAAALLWSDVGWPLWLAALAGAVVFSRRSWRDRLDVAVLAWVVTAVVCIGSVVLTPVDRPFQRYAAEFISRVIFTTAPAVIVLAGLGIAALSRKGRTGMFAAAGFGLAALWVGVDHWLQWLR